jgi:hypothetical protein
LETTVQVNLAHLVKLEANFASPTTDRHGSINAQKQGTSLFQNHSFFFSGFLAEP